MAEAIITGVVALVVCLINNHFQHKRSDAQHNTTISLIDYKLEELTRKVELHNNAVERLYKVERAVAVQDEQIKVANHRIKDLEEGK